MEYKRDEIADKRPPLGVKERRKLGLCLKSKDKIPSIEDKSVKEGCVE